MNVPSPDKAAAEPIALVPRAPAQTQLPAVQGGDAILHIIERIARDPSIDIDRLEKLLAMRERENERGAKIAFDEALAAMQPRLPIIRKNGRIEVRKKDGRGERTGDIQQSTPYALWEDINEAITPVLAEFGFSLSFRVADAEGRIAVTGILARAGHRETTTILLQHDSTGSKNAVQAVGSTTSYGKRYTAGLLLNFTTGGEDTDGEDASDKGTPTVPGAPKEEAVDEVTRALAAHDALRAAIEKWDSATQGNIATWWNSVEQKAHRREIGLTQEAVNKLVELVKAKRVSPATATAKSAVPAADEVKKSDLSADLSDDDEMPDPSKDYPAFVNYLANRVHSFKGRPFEEVETWFQDNIMTMPSGTLMPPDLAMLRGEKERLRSR